MTTRIYSSNKDIIEAYYQSPKELYSDIAEEISKIKKKKKNQITKLETTGSNLPRKTIG